MCQLFEPRISTLCRQRMETWRKKAAPCYTMNGLMIVCFLFTTPLSRLREMEMENKASSTLTDSSKNIRTLFSLLLLSSSLSPLSLFSIVFGYGNVMDNFMQQPCFECSVSRCINAAIENEYQQYGLSNTKCMAQVIIHISNWNTSSVYDPFAVIAFELSPLFLTLLFAIWEFSISFWK